MIYGTRDLKAEERTAYQRGDLVLSEALGEQIRLRELLQATQAALNALVTDLDKAAERKRAGLRTAPVDRETLSRKLSDIACDADPDLEAA